MKKAIIAAIAAIIALTATAQSQRYLELVDSAEMAIARYDWNIAESRLVDAMKLEPGSPGNILLLSNLGIVRFHAGNPELALETLDQAARMAPRAVVVLTNRARVLSAMGRDDEALADYTRVVEIDSTATSALFNRAMLRLKDGQTTLAEPDVKRLAAIEPDSRDTHLAMATLLSRQNKFEEARAHYTTLIDQWPEEVSDEYYLGRAICNIVTDRLSEASIDLNEAIKIDPYNPELYVQRAVLHKMTYRNAEFEADMKRAFELGYRLPASTKR